MLLIGVTSYPWLVSYFGIVNGGSVAVPLDVALPAEELCELMRRADVTMLVVDDIRKDVVVGRKKSLSVFKYIVSMGKEPAEGCLSMKELLAERKDIRVKIQKAPVQKMQKAPIQRDRSGCALYDPVYFRNDRKKQRCDADSAESCRKCDLSWI